jgi:hypothetical protein
MNGETIAWKQQARESTGYSSLEQWDETIKAASEAIRLKPDYPLARKNLDWAVSHKRQAQKGGR